MLVLVMLQVAGPVLPGSTPPPSDRSCSPGQGGEVVVCGRREDAERYRLRPLPPGYPDDPRDAVRLKLRGGGTVGPEVQQGRLGEPQARITLRIPF